MPLKLILLLKFLHANVQVKFVVNDVTKSIESIIGVKQGDILGPLLFIFYLAAVMLTWRATHQRSLCIFHIELNDILTGRRYNTVIKSEKFAKCSLVSMEIVEPKKKDTKNSRRLINKDKGSTSEKSLV